MTILVTLQVLNVFVSFRVVLIFTLGSGSFLQRISKLFVRVDHALVINMLFRLFRESRAYNSPSWTYLYATCGLWRYPCQPLHHSLHWTASVLYLGRV